MGSSEFGLGEIHSVLESIGGEGGPESCVWGFREGMHLTMSIAFISCKRVDPDSYKAERFRRSTVDSKVGNPNEREPINLTLPVFHPLGLISKAFRNSFIKTCSCDQTNGGNTTGERLESRRAVHS